MGQQRGQWKWRLLWVMALLVLSVLFSVPMALGLSLWLDHPSNRVIKEWKQPADLDYHSFGPYSVYILEGGLDWSIFGWSKRRHRLVVAQSGMNPPDYGHMLDYAFTSGLQDTDAYIQSSSVEWKPEGVTFCEADGHRLFIPRKCFVGGR